MNLVIALIACSQPQPCQDAWLEFDQLRTALLDLHDGALVAPNEETFVSSCELLPTQAQPCMSAKYQLDNLQACEAAMSAVPEEVWEKVEGQIAPPP